MACLMAFELAQFLGRISNLAGQGPAPHRQGNTYGNLESMMVLVRAGRSVDFLQLRLSLTLGFDLPTRTSQMWDNQLVIDKNTTVFPFFGDAPKLKSICYKVNCGIFEKEKQIASGDTSLGPFGFLFFCFFFLSISFTVTF